MYEEDNGQNKIWTLNKGLNSKAVLGWFSMEVQLG